MTYIVPTAGRCKECNAPLPANMKRCVNPRCRAWNFKAPLASMDDSTVLLGDTKLSTTKRITTGLVDHVFGGGVAETSVNLLGGEPGAGKTTLCLQLSDILCALNPGREVLYIANEQAAEEINGTAERLDLQHIRDPHKRIRIVKAMGGVTHDIGDLLMRYRPCLTILDSLTKWCGEDMALAVTIAMRLKDYAVSLGSPMIVINQVNKDGDQAGLKKLEHAVDMAGMFDILEGELDQHGKPIPLALSPRRLMCTKNRFGPAPEEQFYQMTATGLVPTVLVDADSEAEEED